MPNYCHNRICIEGADEDLDKLAVAVADPTSDDPNGRFSYARITPLAGGDEFDVWGTTSVYCLKVVRTRDELLYEFESSWDPPLKAIEDLARSEVGTELTIEHIWCEPCTGRYGSQYFADGLQRQWADTGSFDCDGIDGMRAFMECEWPELAAKWWDDEEEEVAA